jgi:hypothetical protein
MSGVELRVPRVTTWRVRSISKHARNDHRRVRKTRHSLWLCRFGGSASECPKRASRPLLHGGAIFTWLHRRVGRFLVCRTRTGLGGMSQAAMTPEEKEARKKKQQVRIAAGRRRRVAVRLPHTCFLLGGGGQEGRGGGGGSQEGRGGGSSSQEGQGGGGSSQEGRGGGSSSQEGRGGGGSSQEGRGGGVIRAVREACLRRATVRVWQCAVALRRQHCSGCTETARPLHSLVA